MKSIFGLTLACGILVACTGDLKKEDKTLDASIKAEATRATASDDALTAQVAALQATVTDLQRQVASLHPLPRVVWKDATGAVIDHMFGVLGGSTYFDADGRVWGVNPSTGTLAGDGIIAGFAFNSTDCSGPAYLPASIWPRQVFEVNAYSPNTPGFYVIQEHPTIVHLAGTVSGQGPGGCTTFTRDYDATVDYLFVAATAPSLSNPPLHPEVVGD